MKFPSQSQAAVVMDGKNIDGPKLKGFKTTILARLKDARGEWRFLFKNAVQQSETVSFDPIFSLPLGTKWFRG
jgi:hypothetical protein